MLSTGFSAEGSLCACAWQTHVTRVGGRGWLARKMLRGSFETLLGRNRIHCAVLNKHAGEQAREYLQDRVGAKVLEAVPFPAYVHSSTFPPSPQTPKGLLYYYTMDIASLLPVCKLCVKKDSTVLDMCAAPGGKSFAILQLLSLASGGLALNEPSHSRMARLKSVIRKCLPQEQLHAIRFTRGRGENWGRAEPDEFDRVLVDAPCSSDRHKIAERGTDLYKHSERYAVLQEKLLLNALLAGKDHARTVYSTCTLSDRENDRVVANVLSRTAVTPGLERVQVLRCNPLPELEDYCSQERTDLGLLVTPTENRNAGPMYVAVLEK